MKVFVFIMDKMTLWVALIALISWIVVLCFNFIYSKCCIVTKGKIIETGFTIYKSKSVENHAYSDPAPALIYKIKYEFFDENNNKHVRTFKQVYLYIEPDVLKKKKNDEIEVHFLKNKPKFSSISKVVFANWFLVVIFVILLGIHIIITL